MPRIKSKRTNYMVTDFCKWLAGEMFANGYTQNDVAGWMNLTQQCVSYKMKHGSFTLKELLVIFEKLNTDESTISKLLKA